MPLDEDLEPVDLDVEPVEDFPEDFPEVEPVDFAVGDEVDEEPVFVLLPVAEVRLLLPEEPDFEPVFEAEAVELPDSLLRPCISPDDMEEAEPPKPDWLEPDIDFESEPEPDIED